MRATAERLVAEQRAAEEAEAEDEEWLFSPAAPGHAPSPAQLPRPRLADRAPARKPLARAKRRPISILPLRYDPRKRAAPEPAPAPTAELWQRPAIAPTAELWQPAAPEPAPTAALWQRWPTAEEAVPMPPPARPEPAAPWAPPPPVASWAATPRPDAPWSPLQEARPGAKPLAKMKRRGITMMPLGSKRARA